MYSLRVLFFILPLYFSHILSSLGVTIWESYSFERQKVYLFLILIILAYIEWLIRFPRRIWDISCKYATIFGILLIIPIISTLYFSGSLDMYWLLGSHEKHHGYLFYSSILSFAILLISSPREHLRQYISWSMASAILVALIAIWERVGGVFDIYGRSEMLSMYPGRSSSTLGNPNYVAGYLLPFVPLFVATIMQVVSQKQRRADTQIFNIAMLGIILIGICVTGSHIAMLLIGALASWYLIVYIFRGYDTWTQMLIFTLFSVLGIFLLFSWFDPAKLLSLQSRFILMVESLSMIVIQPLSLLIGFGPESLLTHFSTTRSTLVDAYFPSMMLIDSSHNIIIDILFQYGILPIWLCVSLLIRKRQSLSSPVWIAVLLLLIFLTFNVLVISHIVILILLIVQLIQYPK